MDTSKMPLIRGDAKRQLEEYGEIVKYSNYSVVWYTGDFQATLCGPCAAAELAEYIKHHDDDEWVFCEGELPEHCDNIEEGSPVNCDECNREIFEGLEECEQCGSWESTPDLTYTEEEGLLCKKCVK
jgi:hypothetical protein